MPHSTNDLDEYEHLIREHHDQTLRQKQFQIQESQQVSRLYIKKTIANIVGF